ncbi:MAG: hypothetical protein ACM3S0_16645 [Acidobacteriota bacterium]
MFASLVFCCQPFRSQTNGLTNLMGDIGGILACALGAYRVSRNVRLRASL